MVVFSPQLMKIQTFSPVFPPMDSILGAFYWLFLWSFKKKSINHFLWYKLLPFQQAEWYVTAVYLAASQSPRKVCFISDTSYSQQAETHKKTPA